MNRSFFTTLLFGRHTLKIVALIIGYSFWLALAYRQEIAYDITLPVNVYRPNGDLACQTSTCVHTIGPRHVILDALEVAASINIRQTTETATVTIEPEALVVPTELDIIDYTPHTITVPPLAPTRTSVAPASQLQQG